MKYQHQKGFIPLVIILLVVLGAGVVGGGYVYKRKAEAPAVAYTETQQTNKNQQQVNIQTPLVTNKQNISNNVLANTNVKVFTCDNLAPSQGETNTSGEIATFKVLDAIFRTYLNDHTSYPTSLDNFEDYGTKQDFSGKGYLYAYYPRVNPTHYHIGMKIQFGASCSNVIASNFKTKASFDSKSAGYVNGFDGTDATILDFHDNQ